MKLFFRRQVEKAHPSLLGRQFSAIYCPGCHPFSEMRCSVDYDHSGEKVISSMSSLKSVSVEFEYVVDNLFRTEPALVSLGRLDLDGHNHLS